MWADRTAEVANYRSKTHQFPQGNYTIRLSLFAFRPKTYMMTFTTDSCRCSSTVAPRPAEDEPVERLMRRLRGHSKETGFVRSMALRMRYWQNAEASQPAFCSVRCRPIGTGYAHMEVGEHGLGDLRVAVARRPARHQRIRDAEGLRLDAGERLHRSPTLQVARQRQFLRHFRAFFSYAPCRGTVQVLFLAVQVGISKLLASFYPSRASVPERNPPYRPTRNRLVWRATASHAFAFGHFRLFADFPGTPACPPARSTIHPRVALPVVLGS